MSYSMHNNGQLHVIDRPESWLDVTQENFKVFSDAIEQTFRTRKLESVDSLYIIVVFNNAVEKILRGSPECLDSKTKLWLVNYPMDTNFNREVQQKSIKAHVGMLKNMFVDEDDVASVDVIMLYNKPISALKLDRMNAKQADEAADNTSSFFPIQPKYSLDRVVLNDDLLLSIRKTLKVLQKFELIFEVWGYNEIEPAPKAILNFYGPPGTGKTMAAHGVANYLGSNILALNYADIESKYVGDAPKNLVKAFETAQKEQAVLFFDEADSFLGKRISNVTSNADQSVNSLRSQMLILLDNFTGIVIFATNLIENYDSAFESRIFRHLFFDMPNFHNRKKIISLTIPQRIVYEDNISITLEQLDQLVNLSEGFNGRHIKNSVLLGLANAVLDEREFVRYSDFQSAFEETRETIASLAKIQTPKSGIKVDSKLKQAVEQKIRESIANTEELKTLTIPDTTLINE